MTSSNSQVGSSSSSRTMPPPPPPGSRVAAGKHSATAPDFDQIFDQDQDPVEETPKKKRKWGKRIGLGLLMLVLFGTVIGGVTFVYLYNKVSIPAPSEFALAQTTTVYYNDGKTPMGTFADVNRTVIDASTLPKFVGQAIVASEDRTFFTNSGVDPKGIARALVNNLRGGSRQGASTLSQQYIERYFGQETHGYKDKLREALMAIKINKTQSKDTILANYMNTIYFGRGTYGIEAASKAYFGIPAAELNLSQAAMIAGIIPNPGNWDPAVGPEMAQKRWQRVLDLMVEDGWITQAEADQQTFPETIPPSSGGNSSMTGTNGYLMQQVRQELISDASFTDVDIDAGGLSIISTIDQEMQAAAVQARSAMPEDTPESVHISLSSIDNKTGAILAEYAGSDYQQVQINGVTQDMAQAGSTFKPFSLIPFLEDGGSMQDTFDGNSPQTFGGNYEVQNNLGISYGNVTVNDAVQDSINTVFVALNEKIGADKTVQSLIKAGIPEDSPGLEPELGNVLGSTSVHNIDLARAYSTLANGGYRVMPHIVTEVKNAGGNTIYKPVNEWEQVFDSKTISKFLPALKSVTEDGGSASQVSQLGLETAGKTGTSSDFLSAQFAGFVPQVTTVVSMYNSGPNGEELPLPDIGGEEGFYGGKWPVDVWLNFMQMVKGKLPPATYDWFDKTVVEAPKPQPITSCPDGQVLQDGACVPAPPTTPTCTDKQDLVNGQCVDKPVKPTTPKTPTCKDGEKLVDGKCVAVEPTDPTEPTCPEGQVLVDGQCVAQPPTNPTDPQNPGTKPGG